jgi:hypothetical protein
MIFFLLFLVIFGHFCQFLVPVFAVGISTIQAQADYNVVHLFYLGALIGCFLNIVHFDYLFGLICTLQ